QVGEQPLDVVLGVVPVLRSRQQRDERFQEGCEAWQHATQQARRDFGIVKQLVEADAETSLHRSAPFGRWLAPKGRYTTSTYGRSGTGHSRIIGLTRKRALAAARNPQQSVDLDQDPKCPASGRLFSPASVIAGV